MNGRLGVRSRATTGSATLLVALFALSGCGGGDDAPKAAAPAGPAKATVEEVIDPAVEEARTAMLAAVPIGTPMAPIDLLYDLKSAPVQGRPFDIEFAVLPEATVMTLRGLIDGSREGLEIAAPAGNVTLEKLQAGTVHRFGATVVPRNVGAHVLTVELQLELPTGPAKRTFSVPVVVLTPAAAAAAAAAAASDGQG